MVVRPNDVGNDLFTVLLVTCKSMAATDYPDDHKLLICDGTSDVLIVVLNLWKSHQKQHNMAKIIDIFTKFVISQ